MRKLAVYLVFCALISLLCFLGFQYLHRRKMAAQIPAGVINPATEPLPGPAPKTNPRIEPILETAQFANVDSYTPEQARLRDFFQSGSTAPARDAQAGAPDK